MRNNGTGFGYVGLILIVGCGNTPTRDLERKNAELQEAIKRLEVRVDLAEVQNKLLVSRLSALESNQVPLLASRLSGLESGLVPAGIDCQSPGFRFIRTDIGPLAISCDDATKYLDGYRVKLKIGNTTAARITGMNLHFSMAAGGAGVDRQIVTGLAPGAWTNLDVVLPGLSADDLVFVLMTGTITQISLR